VTQGGEGGIETVMCGIERQAAFYRAYLIDDRSLTPLIVALASIVALWALVYLVGSIGPVARSPTAEAAAQWSYLAPRPAGP
jgi:hypothetical protein